MTKSDAEQRVQAMLDDFASRDGAACVVISNETISKPWGWVVFYQSKAYLESGELRDRLAGNSPYFVNKQSKKIDVSGTAHPIEYYIAEYEAAAT